MAYIVFDFDGTLADIKMLMLDIGNNIAANHGWPAIDEATYQELSRGSIRDGLKRLKIPLREVPFAAMEGKKMLMSRTDEIQIFPGIPEVIEKLRTSGHKLFVLSANSQKLIIDVLNRHKLGDQITVLPSSGLFGKAASLKRFMRKYRANKSEVWLVGDELRDIEAAKRAGVQVMAVTWGLQNPETLKAANPTCIVSNPNEILDWFNKNK